MSSTEVRRVAAQVGEGAHHQIGTVAELAQRAVAVEAEQASDPSTAVVVIDVLGRRFAADRAQAVLLGEHLIVVLSRNSVSIFESVIPRSAVSQLTIRVHDLDVAGLAIRANTSPLRPITWKLTYWLDRITLRAPFVACRHALRTLPCPAPRRSEPSAAACDDARPRAYGAIEPQAVAVPLIPRIRGKW
jgi:hypothetical protein